MYKLCGKIPELGIHRYYKWNDSLNRNLNAGEFSLIELSNYLLNNIITSISNKGDNNFEIVL